MPNSQNLCEYYFDSRVERISGDRAKIADPRLYFERNIDDEDFSYRLFVIVDEWLPDYSGEEQFDSVKIWFKQGAADCAAVCADEDCMRVFRKRTNSLKPDEKDVEKEGNLLLINQATDFNPSGAGCIEMFKKDRSVARFYFAVNYASRKKIFYTVEVNGDSATLRFECKSAPESGVSVRLLGHVRRLPCLVGDRDNCLVGQPIPLTFKRGVCNVTVKLTDKLVSSDERKLYVALEKNCEDMFVLVSKHNDTIPEQKQPKQLKPSYSCPFCHGAIDVGLEKSKAYRSGGVVCDCKSVKRGKVDIWDENGNYKKNCLICKEEFDKNGSLKDDEDHPPKILPDDFLGHKCFKVAFQGAPRAGKTTYISRFFGLTSLIKERGKKKDVSDRKPEDFEFRISMKGIKNTSKRFGLHVDPINVMALNEQLQEDGGWMNKEPEYVKRGMEFGRKLLSTPPGDYTPFPFIIEVNHKNYVSFYDIAGEDSIDNNKYIKRIAEHNDKTVGIFLIVTATNKDSDINAVVACRLSEAAENLDPDCPVAVILTKMDAIGDRFDSSCACRRFDYCPPSKFKNFVYDGSSVEKFINESSEEIKSFIDSGMGGLDIENSEDKKKGENDKDVKRFKNVKYFCISAFGFPESTYREDDDIDSASYMRFATSSRRMELPFIWMMRQFGVIKN